MSERSRKLCPPGSAANPGRRHKLAAAAKAGRRAIRSGTGVQLPEPRSVQRLGAADAKKVTRRINHQDTKSTKKSILNSLLGVLGVLVSWWLSCFSSVSDSSAAEQAAENVGDAGLESQRSHAEFESLHRQISGRELQSFGRMFQRRIEIVGLTVRQRQVES